MAVQVTSWLERHQVSLYLLGLAIGGLIGWWQPAVATPAQFAITPLLGLLLYATFLGVPVVRIRAAVRDGRFLIVLLAVNFVGAPAVAFGVSRLVAHDTALLVGVLFVLLAPCIDYVIVFTALAGGSHSRLLAATPLLMLVQILLIPVYLRLFVGADLVRAIDWTTFVEAFLVLIVLPALAAGVTQWAASRSNWGKVLQQRVVDLMVPLMSLTLLVVVASQISAVGARLPTLLLTVPVYLLFAVAMVVLGLVAGRLPGLDVPARRALVFGGVTRNSLVVLPLVLALSTSYHLAPLAVVTQTLVELVLLVILVRLVPRLIPQR